MREGNLSYENNKIIVGIIVLIVLIVLGVVFFFAREKSCDIKIAIPVEATEDCVYSDEEISPKCNKITLYVVEGMGDGEIILKPVDVKEENTYDPTYITPGMPIEI